MKLGFIIFGLRENSGCTTNAIHVARYFASGGYSVALVEPANSKSPCLRDFIEEGKEIPCEKDGVTLYPTWDQDTPDAEIVVYDMGATSIAQILKVKQMGFETIICANADDDTLYDLHEVLTDEIRLLLNPLILLKECGDARVNDFKKINFKTYKVSLSKTVCPSVISDNLRQICHFANVTPPEINYDLNEWSSMIKIEPAKRQFPIGSKKRNITPEEKSEDVIIDEVIPDLSADDEGIMYDEDGLPIPIPSDEIEYSGIKIHERDKALKNKPDKVYESQEDYEKEFQKYTSVKGGNQDDVSSREVLKNTVDSAADVGRTAGKKIADFAKKIKLPSIPAIVLPSSEKKKNKISFDDAYNEDDELPLPDSDESADQQFAEASSDNRKKNGILDAIVKPFTGTASSNNTDYSALPVDNEMVDLILKEETAIATTETVSKEKEKVSKLKFAGHLSIFITALKHGAGSSHIAGSIGSTLAASNNHVCFIHRKDVEYPEGKYMSEYTGTEFEQAYHMAKTLIIDRGCLGELSREEMVEMQRADVKILVCGSSESDFQMLARFIHKCGSAAKEWIYVFNLVAGKKKKNQIKDLMREYDYIFLSTHDYDEIPKEVSEMWNKKIRQKTK